MEENAIGIALRTWVTFARFLEVARPDRHWRKNLRAGRAAPSLAHMTQPDPSLYFKARPKIIGLAVTLEIRFPLSLRNVEDLLHERGIGVSHETIHSQRVASVRRHLRARELPQSETGSH